MTDDIQEFDFSPSFGLERFIIASFVTLFGLIGSYDLYEDWKENVSNAHLLIEGTVNLMVLLGGAFLFIRLAASRQRSWKEMRDSYNEAKKSAIGFKSQVEKFKEGVTSGIVNQLKTWKLTPAEQEICLFLLKGFSLQEIADLRQTSERTIRQQASQLYKKTGLNGRTQLSAFFLEDLLAGN